MPRGDLISFRKGTAAAWTSANPTLATGELGFETDTGKFKIGTGSSPWTALLYASVQSSDVTAAVNAVIDSAPGALNTLDELAAALGDDANYAATVTAALSARALASRTVNGHALTADVTVTKGDVGLSLADNVADVNKPASSPQKRAFSALQTPKPWWFPSYTAEAAPAGDIPTYASTDSTVGGASATYSGMVGVPPTAWSSSKITKYGYIQGARTISTVATYPNVTNGHVGPADFTQKWTPTPYFVGFMFDGLVLRFGEMLTLTNNRMPFRVWVDGRYAGEFRPSSNSSGAVQRYHTLTWSARRGRRVVIQLPQGFYATTFGSPDNNAAIAPLPRLPFRCFMLGDSWIEGTGLVDPVDALVNMGYLDAMPFILSLKLGWEIGSGGQGGTKPDTPTADGTAGSATTSYNSPQRIRAITEYDPHLVLIHGTSNADSTYNTTLPANLDDLYAKIRAAAPNAKIVHVGPQVPGTTVPTARTNNRDATSARALANGIPFIDPIANTYINGSGTWGTPVNGGNSSLYYGGTDGTDGAHLRDYSHYADRIINDLLPLLSQ